MSQIQITSSLAGLVREKQNKNFLVNEAICELIDNSIDAGAASIVISLFDQDLHIVDDGSGFNDLGSALNIGVSSKRDDANQIGRYGVGLKDCAIKFSNQTTVSSRGKKVTVNWQAIADEKSDGTCELANVDEDPLTRIILHGYRQKAMRKHQLSEERIAKVYSNLIRAEEIQIIINDNHLEPLPTPKLTDEIDCMVEYRGRRMHICGGIFKSDDPLRKNWRGYNVFYQSRLIKSDITDAGVEDETCTNWYFFVNLIDGEETRWELETNKSDVVGLVEALEYVYTSNTRALLQKADSESQVLELQTVIDSVNEWLGNQRRKGPRGQKSGTVKPTNEGPKKDRTFTSDGPGGYTNGNGSEKRKAQVLFNMQPLPGHTFGEFSKRRNGLLITLNTNNPWIDAFKSDEKVIKGLVAMCFSLYHNIKSADLIGEDIIDGIMVNAGTELVGIANQ